LHVKWYLHTTYLLLHRLINLSCSVFKLHYHICMTNEAHLGLSWWSDFPPSWSGTSMIFDSKWTPRLSMQLFTKWDAQGAGVKVNIGQTICFSLWASNTGYSRERTIGHSFCTEHMGSPLGLDVKSYFIVMTALLWKRVNLLQGNYNSCLFVVFLLTPFLGFRCSAPDH